MRQHLVEDAVVGAVLTALADAALVDDVVARVLDLQRRQLSSPDVLGARRELATIARDEERLVDAIQGGVTLDAIRTRVDALNERKRAARALLSRLEGTQVTGEQVRAAMAGLAAHGTPEAILRHCVLGVVVDRDERAVVVTLPIAEKRSPTREGVRLRNVWLPMSCGGSNWQVVDGRLLLRAPLAA